MFTEKLEDVNSCPLDWIAASDYCIRFYPRAVDPETAQKICIGDSAQLLSIPTDENIYANLITDVRALLQVSSIVPAYCPYENELKCFENPSFLLYLTVGESFCIIFYLSSNSQRYFDAGLHELAWLIAANEWTPSTGITYDVWKSMQSVETRFLVFERTSNQNYKLSVASSTSTYPFICSLRPQFRRLLQYQQMLLPSGIPRLIEQPNKEYLYTYRSDQLYLILPCRAIGKPFPIVRWFKNGVEEVDFDTGNSSFLLSGGSLLINTENANENDRGAYAKFHCTAESELGVVRSVTAIVRPAFISAFHSSRMDVFAFNSPGRGARIECQAPLHYPKSLSFSWMTDGSTERFVSQTDRIFISHDGTLYFSYILKEDATSYACSLALSSTQSGHYGPFFKLKLPLRLSEYTFAPKIDELQPQVFPEHPQLKHTTYLECFAYARPSPRYKWSRVDGRPISTKAKLVNYGRVLKIDSLEPEDSGTYKCTAENEHGMDSAEVSLLIQARPEILRPLTDRIAASNTTTIFDCRLAASDGNIEWFRDAVPISPLLMSSKDRSRLTIKGIRREDSGIYECIAVNEVGSTSSSARLTVVDFMPRFDSNIMPKRIFAVIGAKLMIPCIYHASPNGFVQWSRQNGERVADNGRVRVDNSQLNALVIQRVERSDHGEFICTATNEYGQASFTIRLFVIDNPNVIVKPQSEFRARQGIDVNISCEIEIACEAPRNECPEALFEWTLNDRPVRSLPQYTTMHSMASEAYESDTSHSGSKVKHKFELELPSELGIHRDGRFACTSLFGGAAIEIDNRYVPLAPIHLRISNISSESASLSWTQPSIRQREQKHNRPSAIDTYVVEFRRSGTREWAIVPNGTLQTDINAPINSRSITSLTSFQSYQRNESLKRNATLNIDRVQFRVKVIATNGLSAISKSTEWFKTLPAPPNEIIKNVTWRRLDAEHVLIQWTPTDEVLLGDEAVVLHLQDYEMCSILLKQFFSKSNYGGPNFHYELWWNDETKDLHEMAILYESAHVIRLSNTKYNCKAIKLSIRGVNDAGKGPTSAETVLHISQQAPSRRATNLVSKVINSTCTLLHWQWTSGTECENLYGIKISCKAISNDSKDTHVNNSIAFGFTQWMICGLQPSTVYSCSVIPFDKYAHEGEQSDAVEIVTKSSPPQHAPHIKNWRLQKMHNILREVLIQCIWNGVPFRFVLCLQTSLLMSDTTWVQIYVSETASKPITLKISESALQTRRKPLARIDELRLMYYYTFRVGLPCICTFVEKQHGPFQNTRKKHAPIWALLKHSLSFPETLFGFIIPYVVER
ncbi:unnamed protein product [Anisakis simplex]|uniref:Contactin n=1 Tax=Anisakis simplex TaxID=6269 RepID=A0A0M3JUI4_ANISI|nr:unnamed protein product [Anisakis simplex]